MKTKKCLYPNCINIPKSRGLCSSHYGTAFQLVKSNKISWDTLIKHNKALPKSKAREGKNMAWFLNGK